MAKLGDVRCPRKIKKDFKLHALVKSGECLLLHLYNSKVRVANSLVYLHEPTKIELIAWWNKHYPDSIEAKVICKQNFFKGLPKHLKNYKKHRKAIGSKPIIEN